MGTSKGYQPPTTPEWKQAKSSLTRYINSKGDNDCKNKAVNDYAKAHNKSSSYVGMASTGAKIAQMFNLINAKGFENAINELGLGGLIGKKTEEVYSGIINYFSNGTGDLEDGIIKNAITQILIDYNVVEISDLNKLTFDDFFLKFVVTYIEVDFKTMYYEKIMAEKTPAETKEIISSINQYIEYSISDKYTAQQLANIDWNSPEGQKLIENKCRECYKLLFAEEV